MNSRINDDTHPEVLERLKYSYRLGVVDDVETILALDMSGRKASFPESSLNPEDIERMRNKCTDWISDPLVEVILATNGGMVAGMIVLREMQEDGVYIESMAVDEKFQRQGIGTQLLNSVIEYVSEDTKILALIVSTDNTRAIDFYTQNGFVIKEETTENGVPRYYMEKKIGKNN